MPGKKWPEDKKRQVLEAYALSGVYQAVSEECGVHPTTVARWCKANSEEIERLRARNSKIAEEAIKQSLEERMAEIAAFGKEMREQAQFLLRGGRGKVTIAGIASLARAGVEIELRALGEPSEILELRGKALDELLERELEKLTPAREEGVADGSSKDS